MVLDKTTGKDSRNGSFPWLLVVLTVLVSCLGLTVSLFSTFHFDMTYDEPFHRAWNMRLFEEGITERVSVYNYISTTPILIPHILFTKYVQSGFPELRISELTLLRLPNLLWLALLFLGTFLLAHRQAGVVAACFSVILLSLEPNVLAHGLLFTVDVSFAAAMVLWFYYLFRFSESLSLLDTLGFGLCVGLAFTAKFTAFLLVPTILLIPFLTKEKWSLLFWVRLFLQLLVVAGIAAFVICAFYGFVEVGKPFYAFHFYDPLFQNIQKAIPVLSFPLPADFITAFDHLAQAGKRSEWNVILFQQWHGQGIWYYYLVLFMVKTPVGVLIPVVLGVVLFLGTLLKKWRGESFILFAAAVFFFVYFSFFVKVQVGYRYVLMALPLFSIAAAIGLSSVFRGRMSYAFLLFIILSGIELYPYRDNTLSFSNAFIQPKRNAYKILADSNIDWGQNRGKIYRWRRERDLLGAPLDPKEIQPGVNVFSVNQLLGVFWKFKQHRWVRENLEPVEHIGHTYLVFNVSKEDYERYLEWKAEASPQKRG